MLAARATGLQLEISCLVFKSIRETDIEKVILGESRDNLRKEKDDESG